MSSRTRPTTGYWQQLLDAWPGGAEPKPPYQCHIPVMLPDGRVLLLPLRELPEGDRVVASLIANQASFAVVDALAEHMSKLANTWKAEVIVGLPTFWIDLCAARRSAARA